MFQWLTNSTRLQDLVVCGLALCIVISRATPGVSQGGICTEEEKLRCHVSIILFHGFMQWESHEDHAFLSVGITLNKPQLVRPGVVQKPVHIGIFVGSSGIWGPHRWEICWLSGTSRSADGLCSAPSGALTRFCSSCAAPQWSQLLRSPGATGTSSLKLWCEKQVPWHVNLESQKKAARPGALLKQSDICWPMRQELRIIMEYLTISSTFLNTRCFLCYDPCTPHLMLAKGGCLPHWDSH